MKKARTDRNGSAGKADRKAALGQALRANLARRKAQANARKSGGKKDR